MSRISIEVTQDQHKRLKAVAALSGKSLKDYMLEKTLPVEDDEEVAMQELLEYLRPSIEQAERGEFVDDSLDDVFQEAFNELKAENV